MLVWLLDKLESSSPAGITVEALPPPTSPCATSRSAWNSVETLVVVVAVITMAAVIAGVFARVCGGRHLTGDRDVEGWVERKCSTCLDSGIPPTAPPPPSSSSSSSKPDAAKK